ncbi:methyltransferase domain-containing protein [Aureimonas flava]|uniref:Methyltransferase domain-containing protein n=1 Tax=Aureimonas flava TaxID=2320271 RepID=A0A3A1WQL5_9HYPH|nr:metalloregulator ArsR/SmtB family transcription factor [Aureimonas flava]RIY03363.1 methyltransferase domain-containing protein [Aureimonas flava]
MQASFDAAVEMLKALAEPTRFRLVLLVSDQDLTVSDLTAILGQSQPRISRHLKLLVEGGIVERHQEGAWAYFRLSAEPLAGRLVQALKASLGDGDGALARDAERLAQVRRERAKRAASYFARNAAQWDRLRSLHVPDAEVERALLAALAPAGRFDAHLDVGTGTGRMLELLAPVCDRAIGIDASREMLAIARAKLDAAGITRSTVRQGDVYRLPTPRGGFDLVTLHQVLHYLDDPAAAVRECADALRPGGRLAVVDFAPHSLEFLRAEHAHLRLGFSEASLRQLMRGAGLDVESLDILPPLDGEANGLTVTVIVGRRPPAAPIDSADAASAPLVS